PYRPRSTPKYPLFRYTTLFRSATTIRQNGYRKRKNADCLIFRPQWTVCPSIHLKRTYDCSPNTRFLRKENFAAVRKYLRKTIAKDRKSTRLNSSHVSISYAVYC